MSRRPQPSPQDVLDAYAVALVVSECGEALQPAGNAGRFGLDTPERGLATSRELLEDELGDVLAAIDWGALAGTFDMARIAARRQRKLAKLLDPTLTTNDGRPLAPTIGDKRQ